MINGIEISNRAKIKWNSKSPELRTKSGIKYRFAIEKVHQQVKDWTLDFDELSDFQKNMLIKGELIRTYDSLSVTQKKKIVNSLHLSKLSWKWYKMPSEDKKILLKYVFNQGT